MDLPIGIDRERIAVFCRKHHLTKLALFGSVLTDHGNGMPVTVGRLR